MISLSWCRGVYYFLVSLAPGATYGVAWVYFPFVHIYGRFGVDGMGKESVF